MGSESKRDSVPEEIRALESEERFQSLANTAPVMIWVSGLDKLCIFFNKPWLDFTGRTMEQELGNGWASGVHLDDLDRCLAIYSSSFDARRSFQMEYRLRRADGEYRWILDNGIPYYRSGEFTGFIGSCIDVTEQKALAERLQRQTIQSKDAQRLARIGSWERNSETGIIDWSEEISQILGLPGNPPPTLEGFLNYVHPKDRQTISNASAEARTSMAPVTVSFRIVRPDGKVRFMRAIGEAIRDHRGAVVRTVGSMQDITEQVQAGELLRESEKYLKNAERLAHVGHWNWEIQSNQISCSEGVFRILGRPLDSTPSYEKFLQIIIPDDRERVAQWVSACLTEKKGSSIEVQVTRADGENRSLLCTSEVTLDEDGSPLRLFGACQDITERQQIEATLRHNEQQLQALAGSLLTAQEDERRRISHELHDDLTQRLAALAIELGRLADESSRASQRFKKRLRSLQSGVAEAAETSRHVAYQLHPSELDDLGLDIALHVYCEGFGGDALSVYFSSTNVPGQVNREVALCLYRVAQEGLRNVAKHAKARRAWVTLEGKGDRIVLQVRDDGAGFPVESLSAGGGLGVVSMRERVRNLKGSFAIESTTGKGTVIKVEVPLPIERKSAATER